MINISVYHSIVTIQVNLSCELHHKICPVLISLVLYITRDIQQLKFHEFLYSLPELTPTLPGV